MLDKRDKLILAKDTTSTASTHRFHPFLQTRNGTVPPACSVRVTTSASRKARSIRFRHIKLEMLLLPMRGGTGIALHLPAVCPYFHDNSAGSSSLRTMLSESFGG